MNGQLVVNSVTGLCVTEFFGNCQARMGKLNLKKELPITTTLFPFVMLNLFQHLCRIQIPNRVRNDCIVGDIFVLLFYLSKSTLLNCFFALSQAKKVKRHRVLSISINLSCRPELLPVKVGQYWVIMETMMPVWMW